MNQRLLCHFEVVVNEKFFQFSFVPGTVNFDDVHAALDEFKVEVDKLKVLEEERVKKAQEEKQEAENKENEPLEATVVS